MVAGLKKAFCSLLLAMLVLVSFSGEANAATEQDIFDFLRAPFILSGETQYIHESYILRVERFFDSHKFTPEEYDQILARMKEVLAVMQQEGVADPTAMSWESEHRVLSLIYEGAKVAGIKVVYNKGCLRFYEMDGSLIDEIYYTENAFKITGLREGAMLGAGLLLTVMGLTLRTCRRRMV